MLIGPRFHELSTKVILKGMLPPATRTGFWFQEKRGRATFSPKLCRVGKLNLIKRRQARWRRALNFDLSKRWGDDDTAHEVGMFRYAQKVGDGEEKVSYIHLVALLVKKDWKPGK